VVKTLQYEGDLTQSELVKETLLPGRTVRHAVSLLETESLVDSRVSLTDARRRIYSIDAEESNRRTVP
jgi:DNA-binding MarR family transcriptional regulator